MKNINSVTNFFASITLFIALTGLVSCNSQKQENQESRKPNVLFIGIDDLRPELGSYGNTLVKSPNIDRLASQGVRFDQAHCQVPVCGASRASLLTGLMPTRDRFINYATHVDEDAPDITTLPAHFKNNGYYTMNIGKIFHYPTDNESQSWSEPAVRLDWTKLDDGSWSWEGWHDYQNAENMQMDQETGKGPPYESADVTDNAYTDGQTVDMAVEKLAQFTEMEAPFFLAVGILKPHLPFNAPKKYWDLYDHSDFSIPDNYALPIDVPTEAIFNWGELRAYEGVPGEGPVSDSMAINLIHGYYASVSYVDVLVGRLLDALDDNGQAKNTIVVLWGDHGYFLGEHSFWTKHALYELSIHVPLIVKAPGAAVGAHTNALVDLADLYPTLSALAGLELPEHLQGESFLDVLKDPAKNHKSFSYTRFQGGESIFDGNMRYTKYLNNENLLVSDMLYDHKIDKNESVNVAGKDSHGEEKQRLNGILEAEIISIQSEL